MNERKIVEIAIDDVLPNRFQPRIKFDEKALMELSDSIKEHGVLQPIIVRTIGDKYEIIVGERRYKASVLAGKQTIPAIISDLNDKDSAEVALIENVQRENLTPIEEAISYKKILEMSYLTQNELAEKLDKNQSTVANKLRLLNLEIEVQEALLDEKISERHARSLLKLNNRDAQLAVLKQIIDERLTVRQTDKLIKEKLSKGNEKMNNENNDFNIPTTPIVEEVIDEPKEIEKETENNEEINSLNPGFMDIDKIENDATDIYTPKPLADMTDILKPDETMKKEEVVEEKEETPIPTNRFFTFGNIDDDMENKDIKEANQEIEKEETPLSNNVDVNPNINFDFNSYFKPIEESENEDSDEDGSEDEILEIEDFDDLNTSDEVEKETEEKSKNKNVEVPFVSDFEDLDLKEPQNIIEKSTSANYFDEEPKTEEVPEIAEDTKSLKNAINIIRKASKELENLGYIIDVEEIDFENNYQVTFKISK
ncbi:MAG: ParB/RepB/Spo0J family partition protein [Bacilli bacterium]|nr:ParB/RepB/Spo0J family partition protein [Bacilli bacterium]